MGRGREGERERGERGGGGGGGERGGRERGEREGGGGGRDCYSIRLSSDIFKFYIVTITTTTTVLVLSLLASPPLSGSPMYICTCTYLNALE